MIENMRISKFDGREWEIGTGQLDATELRESQDKKHKGPQHPLLGLSITPPSDLAAIHSSCTLHFRRPCWGLWSRRNERRFPKPPS